MPTPRLVTPELIKSLIDNRLVYYVDGEYYAFWFGVMLRFSEGQRHCWQILWRNFLRGNMPIPQARVLSTWSGESAQVSDLLKRHVAWKTIIVSDGQGHLWLEVPEQYFDETMGATAVASLRK